MYLYADISDGLPIFAIIWNFILGFPQLFVSLNLILFAVCCYGAASSLNAIEEEIIQFHRIKMMSSLFTLHRLRKWKLSHALVCDTIDEIDDCFGPTLFLSVPFILIRFMDSIFPQSMDCFCIGLWSVSVLNFLTKLCYFVQYIFWLSLVCFPVNHLRFSVQNQYFHRKLLWNRQLGYDDWFICVFQAETLLNSLLRLRLPTQEPSINELVYLFFNFHLLIFSFLLEFIQLFRQTDWRFKYISVHLSSAPWAGFTLTCHSFSRYMLQL